MHHYDTIIIGGGLAGVAALQYLDKHSNQKVLLIEKRERIGGNVRSHTLNNHSSDYGSLEIFDWYNAFEEMVKDEDIKYQSIVLDKRIKNLYRPGYESSKPNNLLKNLKDIGYGANTLIKKGIHRSFYEPDYKNCKESYCELVKYDPKRIAAFYGYTYGDCSKSRGCLLYSAAILWGRNNHERLVKGGLEPVLESIVQKTKATILRGVSVIDISNKVLLDNGMLVSADNIILANPYGPLHKKTIQINEPSFNDQESSYTKYYTFICELDAKAKIPNWDVTLENQPLIKPDYHITAVGSGRQISGLSNIAIIYVKDNTVDGRLPAEREENLLFQIDWPESLQGIKINKIIKSDYFEHSMPQMSVNALKALKRNQGKNNIWYAGQYLGFPSMETSVYTGMRAAASSINQEQSLIQRFKDIEQSSHKKIKGGILFIIFIVLIVLVLLIGIAPQLLHRSNLSCFEKKQSTPLATPLNG